MIALGGPKLQKVNYVSNSTQIHFADFHVTVKLFFFLIKKERNIHVIASVINSLNTNIT